jgi:hypothetical protein
LYSLQRYGLQKPKNHQQGGLYYYFLTNLYLKHHIKTKNSLMEFLYKKIDGAAIAISSMCFLPIIMPICCNIE